MINVIRSSILACILFATYALGNIQPEPQVSRSMQFDVYLDESKIGWHRFDIQRTATGGSEVLSEASFDVKFLFITAFRYRHQNAERWMDGCLVDIEADTDSNGKRTSISGQRTDAGFVVEKGDAVTELPNCIMTFAYWDPAFLQQPQLLNPQTGEYLDIDVEALDVEAITIGGRNIDAQPYSIRARDVEVTVWYSQDDEWLALESAAKGGRTLRYELG